MIRFFASLWGRWKYIGKQYSQAAEHELNAKAGLQRVAKITAEADALEAHIKTRDEMEEKGFYVCDNGHEDNVDPGLCLTCNEPTKFVSRETMSGKEKYESDKERDDAVALLKSKRDEAEQAQKAADHFNKMAAQTRAFGDRLRKL